MTTPLNPEDECADYLSEHLSQQARHDDDSEFIPGLWSAISNQLNQDKASDTPCETALSPEFISAYHDCEIECEKEIAAFESQLTQNLDSCKLLADMRDISDCIRQFGSRLIDSCELDVCDGVLGTIRDESPVAAEIELISASIDNSLTKAETQKLEALLQQQPALVQQKQALGKISTEIGAFAKRLEDQLAPSLNCWPTVEQSLLSSNVIPITAGRKRKSTLPFRASGVSIAAAVGVLLFVNWPNLQPAPPSAGAPAANLLSQLPALPLETGKDAVHEKAAPTTANTVNTDTPEDSDATTPAPGADVKPTISPTSDPTGAAKPIPSSLMPYPNQPRRAPAAVATAPAQAPSIVATRNVSKPQIHQLEIASALSNPVSFNGSAFSGFNFGADLMATPASYGRSASTPRIYIRPISEDNSPADIASQAKPDKTTSDTATTAPKYPSAEEYMMNGLKEDPNGSEVNVIYGI